MAKIDFTIFLHRYDDIVGEIKSTSVDDGRGSLSLNAMDEFNNSYYKNH